MKYTHRVDDIFSVLVPLECQEENWVAASGPIIQFGLNPVMEMWQDRTKVTPSPDGLILSRISAFDTSDWYQNQ